MTAFSRPITPGYYTNRLIIIIFFGSLVLNLAITLCGGSTFVPAIVNAASAAAALFLSWALGRELDPANDWSAFTAIPLIFLFSFLVERPTLLVLFFLILCCRLVNRSCGVTPLPGDYLLLLALGLILHLTGIHTALPWLIIILIIDYLMKPGSKVQLVAILSTAVILILLITLLQPAALISFSPDRLNYLHFAAVIAILTASCLIARLTAGDLAVDDHSSAPMDQKRINAARYAVAAFICAELLLKGNQGLAELYPILLVFAGLALYQLIRCFYSSR